MQRFFDVVQDRSGNCIPNALVYVYVGSTSTLATLYSDNGVTTTPNPVTTNSDGEYAFYAANGTYTLQIQATGYDSQSRPGTIIFDPADGGVGVFVQDGSGAVIRTAQNKMRESYSVKDFGAVGDGVTDDSAAVQTAVNNMTAGGTLVFPFGTYKINTSILVPYSNITIIGNGSTIDATTLAYNGAVRGSGAVFRLITPSAVHGATLTATANQGSFTLALSSATNFAVGQTVRCISTEVQYRNDTGIAYYCDVNKITNVSGLNITLESPLLYPLTVSPYTVNVRSLMPIENIDISGFTMLGGGVRATPLANGNGPCGIYGVGVDNISVRNCRFYGFQGIAVYVEYVQDFTVSDCYFEGVDPTVAITEGQNSGFYAAYATYGRRVLFTRCIGQRVRHIFDGFMVFQFVQADSVANNTHRAAFGSHENTYDLDIVGNVSYSCYAGVILRALTANVTGNTFTAGTINNPNWIGFSANLAITMSQMLYTDPGQARFVINSNRIYSYGTGTGAVSVVASCDQLTISDNLFVGGAPSIQSNNADINLNNVVITGNSFLFDGSVSFTSAITMAQAINGTLRNWVISNNTARNHTFQVVSMHGSNDVTNPADCIKITDNLALVAPGSAQAAVTLRPTGYYGDNIVIRGNSQWGTSVNVPTVLACSGQTYRMRGYPVVELNDETIKTNQGNRAVVYASSTTPTVLNDATLFRGSVIQNTASSAGGPNYWVVTTAGTNGTITGVTGAITAGTNILTLSGNDNTKVYAGSFITVAGAGSALANVRVLSIDATFTTATLADNASITVSIAAVTRFNPVISAGANLV
tara:strand:- start:52 stop:2493 length:2442 start_codon:yes stop_codon:yes gene_type:complete